MAMKDEQNYWSKIVSKLNELSLSIATMESCTGGGIANEITNISGASSVLKESYVTYCNEAKIKQGVPAEVIAKYTVYSPETAVEMAKAVKKNANSDIGVGVTGQLGRIDPNNPVPKLNQVWYAVISPNDEIVVKQITAPSDERKKQKEFVIEAVASTIFELLSSIKTKWKMVRIIKFKIKMFDKCTKRTYNIINLIERKDKNDIKKYNLRLLL